MTALALLCNGEPPPTAIWRTSCTPCRHHCRGRRRRQHVRGARSDARPDHRRPGFDHARHAPGFSRRGNHPAPPAGQHRSGEGPGLIHRRGIDRVVDPGCDRAADGFHPRQSLGRLALSGTPAWCSSPAMAGMLSLSAGNSAFMPPAGTTVSLIPFGPCSGSHAPRPQLSPDERVHGCR